MYSSSNPTRKWKSAVLFLSRERKPIACCCNHRHTWLYGATLARLWSKVPGKVALSYIFAFGERSLYCSATPFRGPVEVLHIDAYLQPEGITSQAWPVSRLRDPPPRLSYVNTLSRQKSICKGFCVKFSTIGQMLSFRFKTACFPTKISTFPPAPLTRR